MLPEVNLNLAFRGDRTYLAGATIFDQLRLRLGARKNIEFKIQSQSLIDFPIKALAHEDILQAKGLLGYFLFESDGKRSCYGLVPTTADNPIGRVACNEKSILAQSSVYKNLAEMNFQSGAHGSLIEVVVALNKALIERHYSPSGKLIFTQAAFRDLPDQGKLSVRVKSRLGSQLFISEVLLDGEELGSITFKSKSVT